MEVAFNISKPTFLDFITFETPPRGREEGINFNNKLMVKDMTQEQACEYAVLLKEEFINYWTKLVKL